MHGLNTKGTTDFFDSFVGDYNSDNVFGDNDPYDENSWKAEGLNVVRYSSYDEIHG